MNKFNLLLSYFFFLLINLSLEQNEKQIKVKACIKVSKARIFKDQAYFRSVIDSVSQGEIDESEGTNKIMTLILLNCYNKISMYTAEDINKNFKNFKNIPVLDKKFMDLLELEKWQQLLTSGEQGKLQAEMEGLSGALKDIKSEDLNFEDDDDEQHHSNKQDEQHQNNKQNEDHSYASKENKIDLSFFGFNFTKLNSFTKNVIGLSLIVLIFTIIVYGLVWIRNMNKKPVKGKPKKN